LKCQGVPRHEIDERVEEVAKLLRIEHLIDRQVSGLSGGDSQRVALGRAIIRKAKAFMMDEPPGSAGRRVPALDVRRAARVA
jgi:multiple sugar transport system ATP-binding protein